MATIAEKSRTKEIIDRLQAIINNASPVPLASGKVTIYKDEVQSLLTELATQIEIELKTYHEVNDRKGKIINEAKKEAEKIIYQAEHTASRMRVNKRSTNVAPIDYDMLTEEERSALGNANEIYGASLIYTDEMLTEVNNLISDVYQNIRSDYEIILQVLEEKMNTIASNRAELMDGLQEMDTEDRSQQILEIGQLLSNELFNARMKNRVNPDEYDDGSIQLSLDLQEEQTRQAEEKAQQAQAALAEMTAERDALMAAVTKLKQEGVGAAARNAKAASAVMSAANAASVSEAGAAASVAAVTKTAAIAAGNALSKTAEALGKKETEKASQPAFVKMMNEQPANQKPSKISEDAQMKAEQIEEDEEYEVVYVTEDELEEGEEYEIEYVDEEELEEGEEYEIEYVDEEELEDGEEYEVEYVDEEVAEDSEEYEVEYVDEEELEAGEEYEMESVDEEEQKDIQEYEAGKVKEESENGKESETVSEDKQKEGTGKEEPGKDEKEVKEAIKELEALENETKEIPLIPHFKKSEKIASVPSERIAKMATAITTEKKYSGLISRAVAEREKTEAAVTVEETKPIQTSAEIENKTGMQKENMKNKKEKNSSGKQKRDKNAKNNKDKDIKTDENGNEYVQAAMQFDEDFEIMEF